MSKPRAIYIEHARHLALDHAVASINGQIDALQHEFTRIHSKLEALIEAKRNIEKLSQETQND